MLIEIAVGRYILSYESPPLGPAPWAAGREPLVEIEETEPQGAARFYLNVARADDDHPVLLLRRSYSPGPESGFRPGLAFVEQTEVLFVGAGTWIAAYSLSPAAKLWEEYAELGFLSWSRHGDVVLMSAELTLAAWDTAGRKLWSTLIEPPWSFSVKEGAVHLEAMGKHSRFPLRAGPAPDPSR